MQQLEFTTGQIRPIECAKEGFELIKSDFWILLLISLVGSMIGGASMYVLIGAMICGIFKCYLTKIDGGPVKFEMLFDGFKYFWPSLLVTAVIVVPIVVWIIVLFVTIYLPLITAAVMGNKANESAILGTFAVGIILDIVVAIIMMFIHSLLVFCFPLIVDRGLSSVDAIKLSARASLKNIGGIAGLIGVNFIIAIVGEAAFCVGIYLAIPIITASQIVAYRKVFPRLDRPTPLDSRAAA